MTPILPNSATVRVPERLVSVEGRWRWIDLNVRYGFIDHRRLGPILIDTGYSPRVTRGPGRSLFLRAYSAILRPRLIAGGDAVSFLAAQGIRPSDVRVVILTHFHADHAAALLDFPLARIYANGEAWRDIHAASLLANVHRGVFPELIPDDLRGRLTAIEETRHVPLPMGLGSGYDILGDGSAISVSLPGHAQGHFGLYFGEADDPFLYAVDAHWLVQAALNLALPSIPARLVSHDMEAFMASVARLRAYREQGGTFVLCHDPAPTIYDHSLEQNHAHFAPVGMDGLSSLSKCPCVDVSQSHP